MTATRNAAREARDAARSAREHAMAAATRGDDVVGMLSTMSAADAAVLRRVTDRLDAQDRQLGLIYSLVEANTAAQVVQIQKVAALEEQVSGVGALLTDVSERIGRPRPRGSAAKKAATKKPVAKKAPARKRTPRKSATKQK